MNPPDAMTWDACLACAGPLLGAFLVLLAGVGPLVGSRRWRLAVLVAAVGLSTAVAASAGRQLSRRYQPVTYRAHYVLHGGQVAMWGNWHVEITRNQAGEYRVWVADAYRRPIAARYFGGRILALPGGAPQELVPSLDESYAFVKLPRKQDVIHLELDLPGQHLNFRYSFAGKKKAPPPEYCAPLGSRP